MCDLMEDIKTSVSEYRKQQEKAFTGKGMKHTIYLSKDVYNALIEVYGKEEVDKCKSVFTIV